MSEIKLQTSSLDITIPPITVDKIKDSKLTAGEKKREISALKMKIKYSYTQNGPLETMYSSPMNHALTFAISGAIIYDKEYVYFDIEGSEQSLAQMISFVAEATNKHIDDIQRHVYFKEERSKWFKKVVL